MRSFVVGKKSFIVWEEKYCGGGKEEIIPFVWTKGNKKEVCQLCGLCIVTLMVRGHNPKGYDL